MTRSGEVRECTASNILIVNADVLQYPPRTQAVLRRAIQGLLLECAMGIGLKLCEVAFDVGVLYGADEVFMSGTSLEVLAITSIDGRPVADGKVGRVTRRLHHEFMRRAGSLAAIAQ